MVEAAILKDWDFRDGYSTSSDALLADFYLPALERSISYDRAVGYFASSILVLAPLAFSQFVRRGGRIRLLCSPHLSQTDADALEPSSEPSLGDLEVLADSLLTLLAGSDVQNRGARAMSALLDAGVLEIRFAVSGDDGLFHDKMGLFRSAKDETLSFVGSANESASAWSGRANHEQVEVFRSWVSVSDLVRTERHSDQFEDMWMGNRRGLRILNASASNAIIRAVVPVEPLEDILVELRTSLGGGVRVNPDQIELRDYQAEVLESWEDAGRKGIVRFATGGGKTRTAIEMIRRWLSDGGAAIVLVPSELLHKQWFAEIRELLPDVDILLAGAGNSRERWLTRLRDYTSQDASLGKRVVIATYMTAASGSFRSRIESGPHLLVVGDEVHRVGAPNTRSLLDALPGSAAMGLSATPDRYGDPEGTAAVRSYFGDDLTPHFDLGDAILRRVLVPYDYDFVTCQLSDEEQDGWDDLSRRIGEDMARNDGTPSEFGRRLLIQRARIAKRAGGKAGIAFTILASSYRDGDRWLVYCSDIEHLHDVRRNLEQLDIALLEYHSQAQGDLPTVLNYFSSRGGILLAVKCLDEGVDIPRINRAIVLASSSNPREYVQRRGRILRRSPGKFEARLFDVIVVNRNGLAVTPSEVRRAQEFANNSRNVAPSMYLDRLVPPDADLSKFPYAFTDFEDEE